MRVLSEAERAAIVQCYHNDLSHEEAAYVLGCPVGTVKTHVLRAKQKLKMAMAAWAPEANGDNERFDTPRIDAATTTGSIACSPTTRASTPTTTSPTRASRRA